MIFVSEIMLAQDAQFSQFYNAPMIINPAFTGFSECYRVGTIGRTQWSGLDKPFNTALVFADYNWSQFNSGIGLMALYDQTGYAKISSTELSGLYSYHVKYRTLNVQLGLQGTYVDRSIDYSRLIFEDQFTDITITQPTTVDPITAFTRTNYFDFSTGGLLYLDDSHWIGFSAHHVNRPDQAFDVDGNSRLNIKYSVHAGTAFQRKFQTMTKTTYLTIFPSAIYKSQTTFDQFDMGVSAYINSLMFGLYYRGLIVKEHEKVRGNDAIQFHLGYNYNDWQFYYSYDLTTSRLYFYETWGSHEISIIRTFCLDRPPHKPRTKGSSKSLACPSFDKKHLRKQESWKTLWDPEHNRNVRPAKERKRSKFTGQ